MSQLLKQKNYIRGNGGTLGGAGAFDGYLLVTVMEYQYEVHYYTPAPGAVLYEVKEIYNREREYEFSRSYLPKKERSTSLGAILGAGIAFAAGTIITGGGFSGSFQNKWSCI